MAFPKTPIDVVVEIAPGASPTSSPESWTWVDITNDVRVSSGIQISGGRSDEAARVESSKCTLTLDNRSGNYSPRNPLGIYYGKLKKNCPIRIRMHRWYDSFERTVSSSWSPADSGQNYGFTGSSFNVTGGAGTVTLPSNTALLQSMNNSASWDTEILTLASWDAVPTGAAWVTGLIFRRQDSSNYYRVDFDFSTAGALATRLVRVMGGVSTNINSGLTSLVTGVAANQKVWLRAKVQNMVFYVKAWKDGTTEPAAWQFSTNDPTFYFYDQSPFGLGTAIYNWRLSGNTTTGVASFHQLDVWSHVYGGNVVEWPVRWDQSGNDSYSPITATGVLRRLAQGQAPLLSPIARNFVKQGNILGYWPMEDESGSDSAYNLAPGGEAAVVYDVDFAQNEAGYPTLSGATNTVGINAGTVIKGSMPVRPNTGEWSAIFYIYMLANPVVDTPIFEVRSSGTATRWVIIYAAGGGLRLQAFAADGSSLISTLSGTGTAGPGSWTMLQLHVFQSGGNVIGDCIFRNILDVGGGISSSGSFVGNAGMPRQFTIYGSTPYSESAIGHVFFGTGPINLASYNMIYSNTGYFREEPRQRIVRLCGEQGVSILANQADSSYSEMDLGRQRADNFLDLLYEVEDAEMGILSENFWGLSYIPRAARFGLQPTLALDFNTGHIAAPPEPTDDDQRVRNDWTVSQEEGGGKARATDDAHIAAQGLYDDSISINVYWSYLLANNAAWRVFLGTYDELRFPELTLNLARNPTLISGWMATHVGSRITVANPPSQLPQAPIDVVVEGWSHTITPYGWDVSLSCSPYAPWRGVAIDEAGTVGALVDSDKSTLNSSATSTVTSISVLTPATSENWATAGGFPYDINVGGERMTVTAISGTGTVQTFTVTRSVNGVVKAQSSGTSVTLWQPVYAGY